MTGEEKTVPPARTELTWDEYTAAWARLHGGFDPRLATPVVRGWLRVAYQIGFLLARMRVSPTAVTVAGVVICAGVPLVARQGVQGPFLGALLILIAAVADSVDGAVAVISRRTSRLGYVYDSLADRLGEVAWLAAFWLLGAPGPLVVTAGALSWLHEYLRARAIAAGMREIGVVTVGERPTRVSVALVGLLVAGLAAAIDAELAPAAVTLAAAVWVLTAGFGLGQLLTVVRSALLPTGQTRPAQPPQPQPAPSPQAPPRSQPAPPPQSPPQAPPLPPPMRPSPQQPPPPPPGRPPAPPL